ncbi:MAG TPA: beta-ketoacyl-[acyl-carrier-protein] synthase family protein, partial [Candidatus Omnitrophota bacterium]|nr:beta-ketoacyl-[acyl-carrier-protein] synthase family protein [Candidatus Omnitrophota bacterium]
IGTTVGEAQEIEKIDYIWAKQGADKVDRAHIMKYPVNNIASNVANVLKLECLNRMFTTACAAGNYAIGYGLDLIQLGKVQMALVGGADSFSYQAFTGFNQVRAVAPEKCQPFDKNRKGMMVGEGAGMLILETLENALKRKASIYAEILGYGLSCDANHMTNPHPDGITRCINAALQNAGLTYKDVDYICAHGTGTVFNDLAESKAINNVFKERTLEIPVNSLKSMLGHTMGSASAIEAISCCLTVKNGMIPPTINFETPDPECRVDCVPNLARKKNVRIALNNAFAFGGNNSCLVIKKYERA